MSFIYYVHRNKDIARKCSEIKLLTSFPTVVCRNYRRSFIRKRLTTFIHFQLQNRYHRCIAVKPENSAIVLTSTSVAFFLPPVMLLDPIPSKSSEQLCAATFHPAQKDILWHIAVSGVQLIVLCKIAFFQSGPRGAMGAIAIRSYKRVCLLIKPQCTCTRGL